MVGESRASSAGSDGTSVLPDVACFPRLLSVAIYSRESEWSESLPLSSVGALDSIRIDTCFAPCVFCDEQFLDFGMARASVAATRCVGS